MSATNSTPVASRNASAQAQHPGDALTRGQRLVYILVLGGLTAVGPFTVDLYLPAFPAIEADLGVTSTAVQLTLTGTLIGFGCGQLIVGPWSDKVGRRLPLILATVVHVVSCIGAVFAPDIAWLMLFRVFQGFGSAAGTVVAMAMVRDLFGGKPLVRMLSRLALITGIAPVVAPTIGSQLLHIVDWRGIFWALAIYGACMGLAVVLFIVETLPRANRHVAGHVTMRQRYRALFTDRVFVGVVIIGGMSFAGMFSYLSSSSFLFQYAHGFSPQEFGILFAVNALGIVIGVQTSSRLMRSFLGPQWILVGVTAAQASLATVIVVFDLAGSGFWGLVIPLWFYILACGFGFPAVQVLALVNHGAEAGTAASLLGAMNFGLAGLISPLVGVFGVASATSMGLVMAGTALVATVSLWVLIRPRTVARLSD